MQSRPYRQVDVFTGTPYLGNPLAVVLDGSGLTDAQMQSFARWTNLSETTFVLPPTDPKADYKVRIYTPGAEMQFAGHPTLGSCHAWLEAGGKPRNPKSIVQECGVGLVQIRREPDRLAFGAPPLTQSAPSATLLARVAHAVGLRAQDIVTSRVLDNGTAWLGLLLDDPSKVLQLTPDFPELAGLGQKVGVAALHPAPDGKNLPTLEVRAFAPHMGINEDPVTGSLNASLAQWLIPEGHTPAQYVALQGGALQRAGRVFVERDAGNQVWIGGQAVSCISGNVTL